MNLDTVRYYAPAAFAITPDASLSDSYSHVTTARVLDALQQDGWRITDARQPRTRTGSPVDTWITTSTRSFSPSPVRLACTLMSGE